ncbi:hypothetical protein GQX73_g5762 [Xylaria multiplex]|uniref:Heterokaryon incompatibility domain-containing protein n=1 Tax=Xylaria multiplex TaxID=323545 RepID=A0A7C8MSR8_9PEZI|nr:hypothetical protein GQX73_g5762 [Xylaria multiplex]
MADIESQQLYYKYQPLANGHIRILLVEPGAAEEPLFGRLLHGEVESFDWVVRDLTTHRDERITSLTGDRSYFAVSYAWGQPTFTKILHTPDGLLPLTPSLYGALRCFRRTERPIALWADGVCINQMDIPEISQQVRMMATIYETCETVLVWLGDDEKTTCGIFWLLQQMEFFNREGLLKDASTSSVEDHPTLGLALSSGGAWIACEACKHPCVRFWELDEILEGLKSILGRPYFRRLWPLQERFVKAPQVTFYEGQHKFGFMIFELVVDGTMTVLQSFLSALYQRGYHSKTFSAAMSHLASFDTLISFQKVTQYIWPGNLLTVILHTAPFECSDSHDRIYALRRIASLENTYELTPDYDLALPTLWFKAAVIILGQYNASMECRSVVLALAGLKPASPETSWVPDFGALPPVAYAKANRFKTYHRVFKAGRAMISESKTSQQCEFRWTLKQDTKALIVRGIVLGTVTRILSFSQPPSLPWDMSKGKRKERLSWYLKCHEFCFTGQDHVLSLTPHQMGDLLTQGHRKVIEGEGTQFPDIKGPPGITSNADSELENIVSAFLDEQPYQELPMTADGFCATVQAVDHLLEKTTPQDNIVMDPGRLLAQSSSGHYSWVPESTHSGDSICLLEGAASPFVLRCDKGGCWRVIGDAYVEGVMRGEGWPHDVSQLTSFEIL